MFNALFPIIILITSTLVGFVYAQPLYEDIVRVQEREDQVNITLLRAQDIIRITGELANSLNSISVDDFEKMNVVLPRSVDDVRFVHMVSTLAGRNGIVLRDATIIKSTESTTPLIGFAAIVQNEIEIESLGMRISVTASYETFRSFLRDLEKSLVIMDIDSLRLSPIEDDLYGFEITLHTYWMK